MSFPLWTLGPVVGPFLGYWLGWGLLDHFDSPIAAGTSRFSLGIFAFGGAVLVSHLLRFVERNTASWKSRSLGALAVTIPFLLPAGLGAGDHALRRSLDHAIDRDDASSVEIYTKIGIDPRGPARLASALQRAIRTQKLGAARALLDAGADPNRISKLDPHSALYRAMHIDADPDFY